MKTYDCPHSGEPKIDRRKVDRPHYSDQVERLFNGFENAIRNLKEHGELYWSGYLRGMRESFAELVLKTPSLHVEAPAEE